MSREIIKSILEKMEIRKNVRVQPHGKLPGFVIQGQNVKGLFTSSGQRLEYEVYDEEGYEDAKGKDARWIAIQIYNLKGEGEDYVYDLKTKKLKKLNLSFGEDAFSYVRNVLAKR